MFIFLQLREYIDKGGFRMFQDTVEKLQLFKKNLIDEIKNSQGSDSKRRERLINLNYITRGMDFLFYKIFIKSLENHKNEEKKKSREGKKRLIEIGTVLLTLISALTAVFMAMN